MSASQQIVRALDEARDQLTGPGAPFEIEDRQVGGTVFRVYKNAPANLREAIAVAREHGDKTFLTYGDERFSFNDYFERVDRLGGHLVDHYGIAKGDRVAIAMRNYPEWMMAYAAIVSVGAIVVPLNSWGQADELAYALSDAGARLVFCDEQRASYIDDRLDGLGCDAIVVRSDRQFDSSRIATWDSTQGGAAELPEVDISAGDLAMIMYTSGTTGNPKGAVSTHFAVCQALQNFEVHSYMSAMVNPETIGRMMESGFEPSTLLTMPLFHVSGCYSVFLLNLRGGRKTSIMYKWDPDEALRIIEREHITVFTGVPTMTMAMMGSELWDKTDTSSLFSIGAGGTACPPHLKDLIYGKLPQAYPGTGYGMTETNATCANCTGEAWRLEPTSSGTLSPIVELKTVDDDGNDLAEGETGELYVRSPANVQQYWNLPEASAATFKDGWVATGDIGYLNEDGFLFIVDRKKDMVIRGGENIYPIEVEGALLTHPAVHEAAVFGVPHDTWGEELVATVYADEGTSASELADYLRDQLAAFKVPAHLNLQATPLEKNATGKVLKKAIRQAWLDGQG
ncbi:MAG: class I adenylate-forming enzyme family protein [Pseudomonadota bacterium]